MTTIQERLRIIASKGVSVWGDLQVEAADKIDALEAEIQILTAEREVYAATADRAMAEVESLQLRNQELAVDAGRYQWLRDSGYMVDVCSKKRGNDYAVRPVLTSYSFQWYSSLDKSLDAAMKESK